MDISIKKYLERFALIIIEIYLNFIFEIKQIINKFYFIENEL